MGGQELDDVRTGQLGAAAEVQVREGGAAAQREEGSGGDLGMRDVQMGQVYQTREQRMDGVVGEAAAFVEGDTPEPGEARRQVRVVCGHDAGKGRPEGRRGAAAKVDGAQGRNGRKDLVQHGGVDVVLDVLLEQQLLEVGQEVETFTQGAGGQVLDVDVHALGAAEADGRKVGEIEAADDGAERGVLADMGEGLGEDDGVRDGDVAVQHAQGCGVQSARGQQAGDQVDVAGGVSVGRDVNGQEGDYLVCST